MSGERPPVPEPVKRVLRQEAGFGCCKCGYPLYDYHHIVPYAGDNHFRPEDMMVLCPNCHRDATLGILGEDKQRHYKTNPHNIARGWAEGALAVKQRVLAVSLGSTQFVGDGTFIRVDNLPLLRLSPSPQGQVELSVELYDNDDNLLGIVEKNEWIAGAPSPWDLEYGGRWLLIRSRQREVSLYVDARGRVVSVRGSLWRKRQHFSITKDAITFDGSGLQPGHPDIRDARVADLCFVGGGLVAATAPPSLTVAPDSRFQRMLLVSWPDVDARIDKGIEAWAGLTGRPVAAFQNTSANRRPASQTPLPRRYRKQRQH